MKFTRLKEKNFLGVLGEIDVPLSEQGLVLLEGENRLTSYANSNGACKSSIPEGLYWCLYGKTLRGLVGDDVINTTAGRDCVVTAEWRDNGLGYTAKRFRKVNGKDGFSVYDESEIPLLNPESYIVDHFGPSSLFAVAITFSEKLTDLSDTEKKQLFEAILGVGWVDDALADAKKVKTEAEGALMVLQQTIGSMMQQKDHCASEREKFTKLRDEWETIQAKQRDDLSALKSRAATALNEGRFMVSKVEGQITNYDEAVAEWDNASNELATLTAGASNTYQEKTRPWQLELGGCAKDITRLEGILNNSELDKMVGTPCPTCYRPIDAECFFHVKAVIEPQLLEAREKMHGCQKELDALSAKYAENCATAQDALDNVKREQDKIKQQVKALRTQLEGEQRKVTEAETQLKHVADEEKKLSSVNPFVESVENLTRQLGACELQLLENTARIEQRQKQVDIYGYYEWAFPELRTHLADLVVNRLNTVAAQLSNQLADGQLRVQFATKEALKKGGTRDRLASSVESMTGAQTFKGSSTGEKARVNLIEGLALHELARGRLPGGLNIIFLDEVFDGLDSLGMMKVINYLTELVKNVETVVVITHQPDLKQFFGKQWKIIKDHAGVTLTQ